LLRCVRGHPRALRSGSISQTSGKSILSWDVRICSGFVYALFPACSDDSTQLSLLSLSGSTTQADLTEHQPENPQSRTITQF
jgi:hypothetical protein